MYMGTDACNAFFGGLFCFFQTPDSMQWECQSVVSLGSSEQTELNKEQSTVPLSQHPIQNQQFFSISEES